MYVEKVNRYAKGMYQVTLIRSPGRSGEIAGFSLVNLHTGRRFHSDNTWSLLRVVEEDFAANRFPQSAVKYRSWNAGEQKQGEGSVRSFMGPGGSEAEAGALPEGPTFIIHVLYRQNATWQGTVQWLEGRQKLQYRSVNELFRLMDDAARSTPEHSGTENSKEGNP